MTFVPTPLDLPMRIAADALGRLPAVSAAMVVCALLVGAVAAGAVMLLGRRRRKTSPPPTATYLIEATMRDGTVRRRTARLDVETLPDLQERLRCDAAIVSAAVFRRVHQHSKTTADALAPSALDAAERVVMEGHGLTPGVAVPDDLRLAGWSVRMHRDADGAAGRRVLWTMEKDGVSVSGEGDDDAKALDAVRRSVAAATAAR